MTIRLVRDVFFAAIDDATHLALKVMSKTEPTGHRILPAFGAGTIIGALGGLIGLGGAEFRLPLLIHYFRFTPLESVIMNKTISLVVVASAFIFRGWIIPFWSVAQSWTIVVNLLAGSLVGAWLGAGVATRLESQTLRRIIAVLLVGIAFLLVFAHSPSPSAGSGTIGISQAVAGVLFGFLIGIVASILGVAGGELLIPTLVLLFDVDIKLAGSLSLAVSLPTMLTAFMRYSRSQSFSVIAENRAFVLAMVGGSIVGSFIGANLLGIVPSVVLLPLLALILVVSAIKTWAH